MLQSPAGRCGFCSYIRLRYFPASEQEIKPAGYEKRQNIPWSRFEGRKRGGRASNCVCMGGQGPGTSEHDLAVEGGEGHGKGLQGVDAHGVEVQDVNVLVHLAKLHDDGAPRDQGVHQLHRGVRARLSEGVGSGYHNPMPTGRQGGTRKRRPRHAAAGQASSIDRVIARCSMPVSQSPQRTWKFLTEASFTRPRKFRHQHLRPEFQVGALFCSWIGAASCSMDRGGAARWHGRDALQSVRVVAQAGPHNS